MRKILFLTLFAFLSYNVWGAITALRIYTSSGQIIELPIEDKPSIEINDEDRTITIVPSENSETDSEPIVISFDDVDKCDYADPEKESQTGICTIEAESLIRVSFENQGVKFSHIPDGDLVEVYNVAGVEVLRAVPSDGQYFLSRRSIAKGVHVVRIGSFKCKVSL